MNDILNFDQAFQQKCDSRKKPGPSPRSKIAVALRMLAYGCPADSLDEYFRMGESTILWYFNRFCKAIVDMYGDNYLRHPTKKTQIDFLHLEKGGDFLACSDPLIACTGNGKTALKHTMGSTPGKKALPL